MKDYLDARGFADWLEWRVGWDAIVRARISDDAFARRYHAWTNSAPGGRTSFYSVSNFLTRHFFMVGEWEIPDELYVGTHKVREFPPEVRAAALERYAAGESTSGIAIDLGCSADTILKWARAAGATRPPKISEEVKEAAVDRVLCGESATKVADEIGWNSTSLYKAVSSAKARRVTA